MTPGVEGSQGRNKMQSGAGGLECRVQRGAATVLQELVLASGLQEKRYFGESEK